MMDTVITSRQNNLVRYFRSLREKKNRDAEKRMVVEGVKLIAEAVDAGYFPEKVVVAEKAQHRPQVRELLARMAQGQIVVVSDPVMDYLSLTDSPQGIAALVRIPATGLGDMRIMPRSLTVVLDRIQDPGNAGTIVRTADAFGAQAVVMTKGCADVYGSKTLRSTMGSVFHLPVVRDVELPELTAFLRENRVYTVVAGLGKKAHPLTEILLPRPLAVVFGNEGEGVSAELADFADAVVTIPMPGGAESLNVAVAAGVILYEAFRQSSSGGKSNL